MAIVCAGVAGWQARRGNRATGLGIGVGEHPQQPGGTLTQGQPTPEKP